MSDLGGKNSDFDEDNISDFDEEADDPDNMTIPDAKPLAGLSANNQWSGNSNELLTNGSGISVAAPTVCLASGGSVLSGMVAGSNTVTHAGLVAMAATQTSLLTPINAANLQSRILPSTTGSAIRHSTPLMQTSGVRLTAENITTPSPHTLRIVRPGAFQVRVGATPPRFQLVKNNTSFTSPIINRVVRLPITPNTNNNTRTLTKLIPISSPTPNPIPQVIDLTETSCNNTVVSNNNVVFRSNNDIHYTITNPKTGILHSTNKGIIPLTCTAISGTSSSNHITNSGGGSPKTTVLRVISGKGLSAGPIRAITGPAPVPVTARLFSRAPAPLRHDQTQTPSGTPPILKMVSNGKIIMCQANAGQHGSLSPARTAATANSTLDGDLLSAALFSSGSSIPEEELASCSRVENTTAEDTVAERSQASHSSALTAQENVLETPRKEMVQNEDLTVSDFNAPSIMPDLSDEERFAHSDFYLNQPITPNKAHDPEQIHSFDELSTPAKMYDTLPMVSSYNLSTPVKMFDTVPIASSNELTTPDKACCTEPTDFDNLEKHFGLSESPFICTELPRSVLNTSSLGSSDSPNDNSLDPSIARTTVSNINSEAINCAAATYSIPSFTQCLIASPPRIHSISQSTGGCSSISVSSAAGSNGLFPSLVSCVSSSSASLTNKGLSTPIASDNIASRSYQFPDIFGTSKQCYPNTSEENSFKPIGTASSGAGTIVTSSTSCGSNGTDVGMLSISQHTNTSNDTFGNIGSLQYSATSFSGLHAINSEKTSLCLDSTSRSTDNDAILDHRISKQASSTRHGTNSVNPKDKLFVEPPAKRIRQGDFFSTMLLEDDKDITENLSCSGKSDYDIAAKGDTPTRETRLGEYYPSESSSPSLYNSGRSVSGVASGAINGVVDQPGSVSSSGYHSECSDSSSSPIDKAHDGPSLAEDESVFSSAATSSCNSPAYDYWDEFLESLSADDSGPKCLKAASLTTWTTNKKSVGAMSSDTPRNLFNTFRVDTTTKQKDDEDVVARLASIFQYQDTMSHEVPKANEDNQGGTESDWVFKSYKENTSREVPKANKDIQGDDLSCANLDEECSFNKLNALSSSETTVDGIFTEKSPSPTSAPLLSDSNVSLPSNATFTAPPINEFISNDDSISPDTVISLPDDPAFSAPNCANADSDTLFELDDIETMLEQICASSKSSHQNSTVEISSAGAPCSTNSSNPVEHVNTTAFMNNLMTGPNESSHGVDNSMIASNPSAVVEHSEEASDETSRNVTSVDDQMESSLLDQPEDRQLSNLNATANVCMRKGLAQRKKNMFQSTDSGTSGLFIRPATYAMNSFHGSRRRSAFSKPDEKGDVEKKASNATNTIGVAEPAAGKQIKLLELQDLPLGRKSRSKRFADSYSFGKQSNNSTNNILGQLGVRDASSLDAPTSLSMATSFKRPLPLSGSFSRSVFQNGLGISPSVGQRPAMNVPVTVASTLGHRPAMTVPVTITSPVCHQSAVTAPVHSGFSIRAPVAHWPTISTVVSPAAAHTTIKSSSGLRLPVRNNAPISSSSVVKASNIIPGHRGIQLPVPVNNQPVLIPNTIRLPLVSKLNNTKKPESTFKVMSVTVLKNDGTPLNNLVKSIPQSKPIPKVTPVLENEEDDDDDDISIVFEKPVPSNGSLFNGKRNATSSLVNSCANKIFVRATKDSLFITSTSLISKPTSSQNLDSPVFGLKQGKGNQNQCSSEPYSSRDGVLVNSETQGSNLTPATTRQQSTVQKNKVTTFSIPLSSLGPAFNNRTFKLQELRKATENESNSSEVTKIEVTTGPLSSTASPEVTVPAPEQKIDLLSSLMMETGVFDTMGSPSTSTAGTTTVQGPSVSSPMSGITVTIPGLTNALPVTSLPYTSLGQQPSVTSAGSPSTGVKFMLQAPTATTSTPGNLVPQTSISTVLPRPRPGALITVSRGGVACNGLSPHTRLLSGAQGAVAPRPYMSPVGNTSFIRLPNGSVVSTGPGGVRPPLLRMGLGGAPGSVLPGGMQRPPQISNYFQQQIDDLEEDDGAMTIAETFNNYKPSKLKIGRPHPDPVVESASMASVEPPDVKHTLMLPREEVIDSGRLSALQLETITYVGQKHRDLLPEGTRAGFLIGDGAGVGKGRTIAGIIYDNYLRKRKKSIWISASNDLKYDAERDLADIGAHKIKVKFLSKMKYCKINSEENGNMKRGVLFATYSALIGESSSSGKYNTRMKQIIEWCGSEFEGCIVFDECHRAKNLCPVENGKATKTGLAVEELQNRLPKARVVYASATGASEPKNMAYMVRLGLWGTGTPFKDFNDFISTVEKRGVGAMEIVAMDMKLRGMYIARQLSFQGVTFKIEEAPLTQDFRNMYNECVRLWVRAREYFQEAADLLAAEPNVKKSMWCQFWSAHQRFFKYLCIASKVKTAVELGRNALKNRRCVVIGLQSTGEARTLEQLEKEDGELSDFVSTAKGVLETLVEKHFPATDAERVNRVLALARKRTVATDGKRKKNHKQKRRKKPRMDSEFMSSDGGTENDDDDDDDGDSFDEDEMDSLCSKFLTDENGSRSAGGLGSSSCPSSRTASPAPGAAAPTALTSQESIDRARDLKNRLLRQINGLGKRMPTNTLDQLIDELGGPENVAEMTGRKGHVVANDYGNVCYKMRTEGHVSQEMINIDEKEKFMRGDKLVAIISEAASSGISLQSDRRVGNQLRRVHITLELPWSADRAIQQFGRTHRSNQVNAPEYVFLISELAGERRFASIVAKRLESMGALTHGDRRAADSRDLSNFNIDNQYGRDALIRVMRIIMNYDKSDIPLPDQYKGDFLQDVKPALVGCGLATKDCYERYTLDKDSTNITKFLNRILGMPVELQNALFQYFTDTLTAITSQAKKAGKFDKGILDLCVGVDGCQSKQVEKWVCKHSTGQASTTLHQLEVERGMSWEQASRQASSLDNAGEGFYLNRRVRRSRQQIMLAVLDPSVNRNRARADKLYSIYKPNLGLLSKQERLCDLKKKYDMLTAVDAEDHWNDQYTSFAASCSHIVWNGMCPRVQSGFKCEVGLRRRTYHVLCGSVLNIWSKVEKVLLADPQNPRFHRLQVVRFRTTGNLKHVGTLIPNNMVKKVCDLLTINEGNVRVQASLDSRYLSVASSSLAAIPVDDDDDDDIIMLP